MGNLPVKRQHTRITTRRRLRETFGRRKVGIPKQYPVAVLNSRERVWLLEQILVNLDSERWLDCKCKTPCFHRECIGRYVPSQSVGGISDEELRFMKSLYKRISKGIPPQVLERLELRFSRKGEKR